MLKNHEVIFARKFQLKRHTLHIHDKEMLMCTAVELLQDAPLGQMPNRTEKDVEGSIRESAVRGLVPQIGIMIARPAYAKARGIQHCCTA
jgi:hypothetical protein